MSVYTWDSIPASHWTTQLQASRTDKAQHPVTVEILAVLTEDFLT